MIVLVCTAFTTYTIFPLHKHWLQIVALPEVVRAVRGRVEVYMDGGVRTGTDVLKALSLGAKAVFIGRPALYGLAVGVRYVYQRLLKVVYTCKIVG